MPADTLGDLFDAADEHFAAVENLARDGFRDEARAHYQLLRTSRLMAVYLDPGQRVSFSTEDVIGQELTEPIPAVASMRDALTATRSSLAQVLEPAGPAEGPVDVDECC
jgi:hypothetical protein